MVGMNVPMTFHLFSGWKRSLFGDHYVHGLEDVRSYTRLKTIAARWPQASGRLRTFKCRCLGSWNPEKPWHLSSEGAFGSNPALTGGPHVRALRLFTAALICTSACAKARGIACTGHGSKVPPPVKQRGNAKREGRRRSYAALSKPDVYCCRWQRRRDDSTNAPKRGYRARLALNRQRDSEPECLAPKKMI